MKRAAVGVVLAIVVVAGLANVDARGVDRVCVEATVQDADGTTFSYLDPDGQTQSYTLGGEAKILGLAEGEQIGFSYQPGRLSGMLYEEQFFLVSESQEQRVSEFGITQSGRGSGQRAEASQSALPLGCPH